MNALAVRRPLAASLVTALAAGAFVLGTDAARAESLGALEVTPGNGTDATGIALTTAAPCPEPATNLIVSVKGTGFPAEGQIVVSNSPIATYAASQTGGIVVPLTQTMRDYASTAGFTTLTGRYDFTLTCRPAFGSATYGDFSAPIWFTSDTTYQSTAPVTRTSTTLAVAPAAPVVEGTAVKLTATVAPATAAGTVRFLDGATPIGAPVPVTGGTATLTTSALTAATHGLKAEFVPADPAAVTGSASAALSYTVKIKAPVVTAAAKVTGTTKVGSAVTCAVGFNGASTVGYSWLRDGAVIAGVTGRTKALIPADHAHKIACRAQGTNTTGSAVSTSPAAVIGLGPAVKNTVRPTISGAHRTGRAETARPGTWTPAATTYTYVWSRDGRAIRGATRAAYTPTTADRGHKLTVTVTARRAGYANGTATSGWVRVG
ncbi:Ig-like domain repeat protein [Streptomyces sp. NPDC090025]|uniref:Ig-like domain repeat protein n=1 Tax=Streptomyces sp. NPDC090025 TaxID=3365922 RepID=UPI0038365B09